MKTTPKNIIEPMEIAFKEAKKAYETNEVPVGAVITDSHGNIISRAFNQVETQQDPTAHAEILAIKSARTSALSGSFLSLISDLST